MRKSEKVKVSNSFDYAEYLINQTDAYDKIGVYLFYDENECLEFFELFSPFSVSFRGISIFDQSVINLKEKFKEKGVNLIPNSVGFDVPGFGFGLYINDGRIVGVCVYKKGYYDD